MSGRGVPGRWARGVSGNADARQRVFAIEGGLVLQVDGQAASTARRLSGVSANWKRSRSFLAMGPSGRKTSRLITLFQ